MYVNFTDEIKSSDEIINRKIIDLKNKEISTDEKIKICSEFLEELTTKKQDLHDVSRKLFFDLLNNEHPVEANAILQMASNMIDKLQYRHNKIANAIYMLNDKSFMARIENQE